MVQILNELVLNEIKIADVLEHRFGDGAVYVPANNESYDYHFAKDKGFINEEGYITRKGKQLAAKYLH